MVLHLGFHLIYELFRGLILATRPGSQEEVQAAGAFLADLEEIEYLPPVESLLARDFHRAARKVEIITTLGPAQSCRVSPGLVRFERRER